MQCDPYVYCQPGAAETIWRVLDLVCVVSALALPFVAFRRWGGSQRNAGAILAVGCYLVMLSVAAGVTDVFVREMSSARDRSTGSTLAELATFVGFVSVLFIAGAVASAPTSGMRVLGGIVIVLAGLAGAIPLALIGYDCASWALSWNADRLVNDNLAALLWIAALIALASLALVVSVIALVCQRHTRILLVRAGLLGLAGTEIEAALLKLEGPPAWLLGSRLAGLDLIIASMVIGAGIFVAARALGGERVGSRRWRSLPALSGVAPLLVLAIVSSIFFHPLGLFAASTMLEGHPLGAAVDARGNVYVVEALDSDSLTPRIAVHEFTVTGRSLARWPAGSLDTDQMEKSIAMNQQGVIYLLSGYGGVAAYAPTGRRLYAKTWKNYQMTSLTADRRGNVYAVDALKGRVIRLSFSGNDITSWPLRPRSEFLRDVSLDQHDTVYTAGNGEIDTFSRTGKHLGHWNIASPCCINNLLVSASGNVYGADDAGPATSPGPREPLPGSIVELSPRGRTLRTWTEPDQDPYTVAYPQLAAMDQHGGLYVVDKGKDRLTHLSPSLHILSVWH